MSLIFDALQRAEGERSGLDLSESAVTDVLQRVERQALSERGSTARTEMVDVQEDASPNGSLPMPEYSPAKTDQIPLVDLSSDRSQELINQVQAIPISIAPQTQLVCLTDSESLAAEKFRFLGVRLRHLRRERPLKKVLITSTIPREGKSTVAANLACTLARKKQQRTLLLEGDVRRPSLSHLFGLEKMSGLCEWLQGDHKKSPSIYHLEGSDLWILPSGSASGNPLELLQSVRLSTLMDQLTTQFDWIVIDSPPVLPLADTSVWSRIADGILLVTRQGITEKRQLQRGVEALDHKKLIGALINSSQSSASSDHYYYYPPSSTPGSGSSKLKD